MILILDISKPFQPRPGRIVTGIKGVKLRRFWWLWFAVTYCPLSQFDYEAYISKGLTEWRYR